MRLEERDDGRVAFHFCDVQRRRTVLVRPVDLVQPKGATRPVEIFELIGSLGTPESPEHDLAADDARQDFCARWAAAYDAYRVRDWAGAHDAFAALTREDPDDRVAAIYVARARAYAKDPPPADRRPRTRLGKCRTGPSVPSMLFRKPHPEL